MSSNTCAKIHRFVTTLAMQSESPDVTKLYVLRSYDYYERESLPKAPKAPKRKMTYRKGQDPIDASRNAPKPRRGINEGEASTLSIPEVARAATAAITYFEPLKVRKLYGEWTSFEDGGFGSTNNPTVIGLQEVWGLRGRDKVGAVVSIGTARSDKAKRGEEQAAEKIQEAFRRHVKSFTSPETGHEDMETHAKKEKIFYRRLNPTSNDHLLDIELDDWFPRKAKKDRKPFGKPKMLYSGEATLSQIEAQFKSFISETVNQDAIRICAEELVERRRARTKNASRWERYATGSAFRCHQAHVNHKCEETYNFRDAFERHLLKYHELEGEAAKAAMKRSKTYFRYQAPQKR